MAGASGARLEIRVLGPYGGSAPGRRMTTFLINGATALDAGALTPALTIREQMRIRRVIVTHPHLDHVATLPFFFENVFGRCEPIEIAAPASVLAPLRRHLFNGALWPDFSKIRARGRAAVRFRVIPEGGILEADGLAFRPVRVSHVIPTYGYLVSGGGASVLFSGDTGPTRRLWRLADRADDLRAIFLEVSFSDAQAALARTACHLTPALLERELAKARQSVPVFLYHMKPPSLPAIRREVRALANPRLRFARTGQTLRF